jgi:anti-sigma factor RsiW
MKETVKTVTCERVNDLVSFLYGEISEREAQDFESHLQLCSECRTELASFGDVRQSVNLWKKEALGSFVSPQVIAPTKKRSAVAAFHEFFHLSPLWLKIAVGFATVLFLVMLTSLVVSYKQPENIPTMATSDKQFSQEDLKRAVATALKEQEAKTVAANGGPQKQERTIQATEFVKNREIKPVNKSTQWGRRSLSKSERDQLAADLRLTSAGDDESLNLLGERINQEY